jgi:CRP-like cAMP-binding protein
LFVHTCLGNLAIWQVAYLKGDTIYERGSSGEEMYIVVRGRVGLNHDQEIILLRESSQSYGEGMLQQHFQESEDAQKDSEYAASRGKISTAVDGDIFGKEARFHGIRQSLSFACEGHVGYIVLRAEYSTEDFTRTEFQSTLSPSVHSP